ncbi:hypothetical protein [Corynebacterium sp. HMSC074A01]|uniref:hypothetical protein n=1 Tax=Corynebacterium sp. HMSC074A01 TaxID=1715030 RepID=UPI0008A4C713|nr:hypothetical protein [Corynebacterium sp. HMSC074A01]OHF40317.1 hypothetical protein HMPREF2550_00445 [Corynebacterium sp. HMSC074A01]
MKRIAAASLAAVTALSLAAAPAQALPAANHDSSSKVTDEELGIYAGAAVIAEALEEGRGFSKPYAQSSEDGVFKPSSEANKDSKTSPLTSSLKNDANQGYPLGTTYDILVGTGIAVAVLAVLGGVAASGVIPGVTLPNLPF